ncbi:MAG: hypothetical protein JXA78_18685 [Anaerolineales bacterium]|nr:hypothetical protein [Anaerolineales bacterium]
MAGHKIYTAIVTAVKNGQLKEPFSSADFQKACPGLAERTYRAYLPKHRQGNPGGNVELFERIAKDQYRLLRPFKHGLE